MSNKFATKKDQVNVEVVYLDLPNDEIFVIRNSEDKEQFKDQAKIAKARFDRPNWKNFNDYIKGCVVNDIESGMPTMDTVVLRDHKLRYLLKGLKDGDGEKIKLDADFFDNLMPDFASALIDAYENTLDEQRLDILKDSDYYKTKMAEIEEEEKKAENGEENIKDTENKEDIDSDK